jgi:hypothetical protein
MQLLKEYKLRLIFLPVERDGFILHGKSGEEDQIVIRDTLPENQIESVVLHEIGHAKFDDRVSDSSDTLHCKDENNANNYMIEQQVKRYVDLDNDPLYTNYIDLAKSIGTGNYQKVKNELQKYIDEENKNE